MSDFFIRPRRNSQPGAFSSRAFTLVEVLVSMVVLLILVVWITQLTSTTGTTISQSQKYIDADSQARLIFSRMSVDFANMMQRTDVDFTTFKHPTYTVPPTTPSGPTTTVPDNLQTGASGGGNDQCAFYAEGLGYYINSGSATPFPSSARAPVALVAYNVQADANRSNVVNLQRMSKALGWDSNAGSWQNVTYLPLLLTTQGSNPYPLFPPDPTSASGIDPDYCAVGDQVFRLEYNYLLKPNPATNTPARLSITPWDTTATTPKHNLTTNGLNDVAAIVVAMAVLDTRSRVIISPASIPKLIAALPDAVEPTASSPDILTSWTAAINASNFASTANIPQSAAAAVRVYQHYFYLDGH